MQQPLGNNGRAFRRSLKEFLRGEAKPSTKYCVDCGSVCAHLPAQFWLDGDEEKFDVSLPFCPHCNPELLSRLSAVA